MMQCVMHAMMMHVNVIFVTPMDCSLVILEGSLFVEIFVTAMYGRLVIIEGSLLSRFLLLQWMVEL